MLIIFMLYGFILMMLDPFLWGIASYAIFMLLTKNDRRWQIGAWISAALFFMWDEVVCGALMNAVGVSLSDESITDFMGPDIWSIGVFDVLWSIGLAFGGFVLGRLMLKRVARALQERSDGQPT